MGIYENILNEKVDGQFKKNLSEAKHLKEAIKVGDAVEIMDLEGNTTVVPASKVTDVDTAIGGDGEEYVVVQTEKGGEDNYSEERFSLVKISLFGEGIDEPGEEDHSEEGLIQDDEERAVEEFLRGYEASIENVLTQNLEAIMKKMTPQGFYFRGPAVINQIKKVTAAKLDQITREFYSQVKSQSEEEETPGYKGGGPFDSTEETGGIRRRKREG